MLQIVFAVHILLWGLGPEISGSRLPLNAIVLLPLGFVWIVQKRTLSRFSIYFLSIATPIIVTWTAYAWFGLCRDGFLKAAATAPIWLLLGLVTVESAAQASLDDFRKLRETAFAVLSIAIASIIIEAIFPGLGGEGKIKYHIEYKYSGIYSEPSHVAISLFPALVLLFSSSNRRDIKRGFLFFFLLLALSRSSTLILLSLVALIYFAAIRLDVKRSVIIFAIVLTLGGTAFIVNYDLLIAPSVDRVMGVMDSSSTENISSMVYIKGWEDAMDNLSRTSGIGLGFNMMGCTPLPEGNMYSLLFRGNVDLNNTDGSFILSKLISELGFMGLFLYLFAWLYLAKRSFSRKTNNKEIIEMMYALLFVVLVTAAVRSSGYFHGSTLILFMATAGIWNVSQKRASL